MTGRPHEHSATSPYVGSSVADVASWRAALHRAADATVLELHSAGGPGVMLYMTPLGA